MDALRVAPHKFELRRKGVAETALEDFRQFKQQAWQHEKSGVFACRYQTR